jgi:hypothetical protein
MPQERLGNSSHTLKDAGPGGLTVNFRRRQQIQIRLRINSKWTVNRANPPRPAGIKGIDLT